MIYYVNKKKYHTRSNYTIIQKYNNKKCKYIYKKKQYERKCKKNIYKTYLMSNTKKIIKSIYAHNTLYNCNKCNWKHISKYEINKHIKYNHPKKYTKKNIPGKSKGEKKISYFLHLNKIKFTMEKTFNNLYGIGGRLLRYDFSFYINKKHMLIEYDGEYHYKIIKGRTNKYILKKQQLHDKIKDNYAKQNNISLLRIPYYEFNNITLKIKSFLNIF
jgi:hypothetical protein